VSAVTAQLALARGRPRPLPLTIGVGLLAVLVLSAVAAPLFGKPLAQDITNGLSTTGLPLGVAQHGLLGTDDLGREMLPRLAYGARMSLSVAALANFSSLTVGATVGVIAGYYRGRVEMLLMRITDIALAMPYVLAALVLATVLSSGLVRVIVIITALFWAYPARLVYGEVLRLRRRGFVEAAEAAGARGHTTIRTHIVPHIMPLLLTYAPLNAASAVLFESTLSYLGAGIDPPTPSWGNMIYDGQGTLAYAPHMLLEPAIALAVTVLALLLIARGLKEWSPETRRASWLAS
jgi:peptide/nickel transport system permease protein